MNLIPIGVKLCRERMNYLKFGEPYEKQNVLILRDYECYLDIT